MSRRAGVPTIASAANTAVTVRPNATGQLLFRRPGSRRIIPLFIKCETEFNAPFLPFAPGIASDGKDAPARLVVYLRRNVRPALRAADRAACGSVAAGDPFLQVGPFGADGGIRPVTGVDDRVRVEDEQPVADRVDDRAEVGERTPGRARAAGEQRVPAEQPALIGQVEADGAA